MTTLTDNQPSNINYFGAWFRVQAVANLSALFCVPVFCQCHAHNFGPHYILLRIIIIIAQPKKVTRWIIAMVLRAVSQRRS